MKEQLRPVTDVTPKDQRYKKPQLSDRGKVTQLTLDSENGGRPEEEMENIVWGTD